MLGVFGVCALLAAVWLLGTPETEHGVAGPPALKGGSVTPLPSEVPTRTSVAAGGPVFQRLGMSSTESLRRSLASAPNLRVYVHEAMQRPELGGYYYAARAIQHCGLLPMVAMASGDKKHENKVAAKKALELELVRCEGVIDQFGDITAFYENLFRRHDHLGDPLRSVHYKLARDAYAEPAEALLAALATAEPHLLDYALTKQGQAIIDREKGRKIEWTKASRELVALASRQAVTEYFGTPAADEHAHILCLTMDECPSESAELDRRLADPQDRKEYEHYKAVLAGFLSKLRRPSPG